MREEIPTHVVYVMFCTRFILVFNTSYKLYNYCERKKYMHLLSVFIGMNLRSSDPAMSHLSLFFW